MKAIQIEALRKLDSIELKVLETAAEQLGGNVARLDYTEIARAVGTSRQAVSYNIKKLVAAGLLRSEGVLRLFRARGGFLSRYSRPAGKIPRRLSASIGVRISRRRFEAAGQNSHGECSSVNKGKKEVHTAQFFTTE